MKRKQEEIFRGRLFAVMLLLFEIGIMFAYGYASFFPAYNATNPLTDYSN